jgi:hypothetical protein
MTWLTFVVGHIEGRQVARCRDVATRGGGSATYRHGLSTCHPDGAPIALEEDTERERVSFIRKVTPRAPTKPRTRKPARFTILSYHLYSIYTT